MKLTFDEAIEKVQQIFLAAGVDKKASLSVSNALVLAESYGQSGHGFSRIPSYLNQLECKKINAKAKIKISHPSLATSLIDADYGFAYPALDLAIESLEKKANQFGIASASIIHSHHCGSLGIQVEKLANQGLIALMFANSPKAMPPFGGKKAIFGTNPIAFACPRKNQTPLVIDLSLSKVARGKIMRAKQKGEAIPLGIALDKNGNPTSNCDEALKGMMLPIAEAKGSALALMVEILAAIHTPSNLSAEASSFFDNEGGAPNVGQFLLAIKPGINQDPNHFYARIETLLLSISELEGARLPGEKRAELKAKVVRDGFEIESELLN